MGETQGTINILIRGIKHLGNSEFAVDFFSTLEECGDKYIPFKIGISEPIRTQYSIENAKKLWDDSKKSMNGYGGLLFKAKSNKDFHGSIEWLKTGENKISIYISPIVLTSNENVQQLIDLSKKFFSWSNGVYGYGAHFSQLNIHYIPGINYKTCLGGITWLSLFGEPYVEMFGRDALRTAPCSVEEFAENCFLLLTSDMPMIPTDEILKRQQMVREHLGSDAFFRQEEKENFFREYTDKEILEGKDVLSSEGYRHPDFAKYLQQTKSIK